MTRPLGRSPHRNAPAARVRHPRSVPSPPAPRTGVGFAVGSGLVLAAVGRLVDRGAPPRIVPADVSVEDALPRPARRLLAAWFALAALATWGRDPRLRRVLLPYVGVLGAQAVVERTLTQRFSPTMGVLVGLAYTPFRLWQLRRFRAYLAYLRDAGGGDGPGLRPTGRLLAAGTAFWTVNLIFLAWASVRGVLRPAAVDAGYDAGSRRVDAADGRWGWAR